MKELVQIEHNGQRILTTQQLAEVYETDINNIKNNYKNHKDNFQEGKHYYFLQGEDLKQFKNLVNNIDLVGKRAPSLYLWTERGASRHCKILDTEKAWEQFDNLEETYFNVKQLNPYAELSPELQAIFVTDKKVQAIQGRVERLENTMTIDYTQQEQLREMANSVIVNALGGKCSSAYKVLSKKAFAEFWRHYKRKMSVNSYKNTAVVDFYKS